MSSKFGKGLTYCLGLFLCHSERDYLMTEDDRTKGIINKPYMWFYGAADHIYELTIPIKFPKELKQRLKIFKQKVLHWRLPMDNKKNVTEKDKIWAINEAKELLVLIDTYFGIKTIKGDWL